MCKSSAEGGKRCGSHISQKIVETEKQIQHKVLNMAEKDIEPRTNFTHEDYDEIRSHVEKDPTYVSAYKKQQELLNRHIDYEQAVQNISNFSEENKHNYLMKTNSSYNRIVTEKEKLQKSVFSSENSVRISVLENNQEKMINELYPVSKDEIETKVRDNPHAKPLEKARFAFHKINSKLNAHYADEQQYKQNEAYSKAFQQFAQTDNGRKMITSLAESYAHRDASNFSEDNFQAQYKSMAVQEQKLKKEYELQRMIKDDASVEREALESHQDKMAKLRKARLAKKNFNDSVECSNKFKYIVNVLRSNNKNLEKPMKLPVYSSNGEIKSITIETNEVAESRLKKRMENRSAFDTRPLAEVREKAIQDTLSSSNSMGSTTSLQFIRENPVARQHVKDIVSKYEIIKKTTIQSYVNKIMDSHKIANK